MSLKQCFLILLSAVSTTATAAETDQQIFNEGGDSVCTYITVEKGQPGGASSEYCYNPYGKTLTGDWRRWSWGSSELISKTDTQVLKLTAEESRQLHSLASRFRVLKVSFSDGYIADLDERYVRVKRWGDGSNGEVIFKIDDYMPYGWPRLTVQKDLARQFHLLMQKMLPPTIALLEEVLAFEVPARNYEFMKGESPLPSKGTLSR